MVTVFQGQSGPRVKSRVSEKNSLSCVISAASHREGIAGAFGDGKIACVLLHPLFVPSLGSLSHTVHGAGLLRAHRPGHTRQAMGKEVCPARGQVDTCIPAPALHSANNQRSVPRSHLWPLEQIKETTQEKRVLGYLSSEGDNICVVEDFQGWYVLAFCGFCGFPRGRHGTCEHESFYIIGLLF